MPTPNAKTQPNNGTQPNAGAEGANAATNARETQRSQVSQVAELLRKGVGEEQPNNDGGNGDGADDGTGEAGEQSGTPGEAPGDGKKRTPKTLAALAETLGVKVEDLYDVEFSTGDTANGEGETRKLGELKDQLTKDSDLEARELKFEEKRIDAENELLRARQDLAFIYSQLPASAVTPAIKEKAAKERERVSKIERARTLQAIPEWADEAIEEAERDGMSAFMGQYGFGAGDLDRINDHRWLKLLRDNWQRSERVKRALAKVEEEKSKPAGTSAPSGQPRGEQRQVAQPTKANPQKAQVSKIGKLLREGA